MKHIVETGAQAVENLDRTEGRELLQKIREYRDKRVRTRNGCGGTDDALFLRGVVIMERFFDRFEVMKAKHQREAARRPDVSNLFEIEFATPMLVLSQNGTILGSRHYLPGNRQHFDGQMANIILSKDERPMSDYSGPLNARGRVQCAHLVNPSDASRLPRASILKKVANDISDLVGAGWRRLSGSDEAVA